MRLIQSIRLPGVVSGIAGSPSGADIIAIDALEGVIQSIIVKRGALEHVNTLRLGNAGGWSRSAFPFIQINDYFRTNGFACAVSQAGDIVAVTAPSVPLTLLALPSLEVIRQFGGIGEVRSLCWSADPNQLIINRLIGEFVPKVRLQSEAFVLNTATGNRSIMNSRLPPRMILAERRAALISLSDLQGATLIHAQESQAPYRPYDFEVTCYVRPDGVTLNPAQTHLAIVELDNTHRLSVIDLQNWRQNLLVIYAGETTRPDHAHNLSLLAFDPQQAAVYTPGLHGTIYRHHIHDGGSRIYAGEHTEVAGLILVQEQGVLISADTSGTIHLWELDSPSTAPQTIEPESAATAEPWPLRSGDNYTRTVEFDG